MGTNVESENLPDAVRVGVGMFLWAPHRVLTLKMPERHLVAPNTSSPALGLQRPRQWAVTPSLPVSAQVGRGSSRWKRPGEA